jgi:hypothetical protein
VQLVVSRDDIWNFRWHMVAPWPKVHEHDFSFHVREIHLAAIHGGEFDINGLSDGGPVARE